MIQIITFSHIIHTLPEIIVPEGNRAFDGGNSKTQKPLVVALARAFRWQELLETGKFSSIASLAKRLKVDRAYVSRILNLTLLAPDIVEAIMNGDEPSGLSLAKLTNAGFDVPGGFQVTTQGTAKLTSQSHQNSRNSF